MKKPNILLIAIDSLSARHMSCYGYHRLTTPHIDHFAQSGTLFENTYSAHVPTTSAYASMLTGRDCFGTQVVALRHKGGLTDKVRTLAEILRDAGYASTCIGFKGNPSSRGFDQQLSYEQSWGSWENRPLCKAQKLNEVAQPEIERLTADGKPWFIMLRHMDPHSPYLPPPPYERMFYHGNEFDPANNSMEPVFNFKPFADYFKSWMPPGLTDRHYMDAQYDGAIAYMDACIQSIFHQLETLGILDDTIVVLNGDHGETLYEHECWYDHHGMYDNVLHVPLIIRYPRRVPTGKRVAGYNQHKDLVPTLMNLAGIKAPDRFDGRSLLPMIRGQVVSHESEFYITECTWMRKHGWRTPQWKLIVALEPDFHFKPEVELYNLVEDPEELTNLAGKNPEVVTMLRVRMDAFIRRREQETGLPNPIWDQGDWHGKAGVGAFKTSQQAYDTLHIGNPETAARMQAQARQPKPDQSSAASAAPTARPGRKKGAKRTASAKPPARNRARVHRDADTLVVQAAPPRPRVRRSPQATSLVTVIGRGHSGTRAMSHTLSASGVYMGAKLNQSGDLIPAQDMYEACRVMAGHVRHLGGVMWDFSQLHTMPIDPEWTRLVESFLDSVLSSNEPQRGWKLPETTLVFPWIVRKFPDIRYIHWVRDPRDSILSNHMTDDLAKFGVPYEATEDVRLRRAISWKYQAQIVRDTPKPKHFITVRLEDFVLDQDKTLKRLEEFLDVKLAKIPVKPEVVGRWKTDDGQHDFDFLAEEIQRYGYK